MLQKQEKGFEKLFPFYYFFFIFFYRKLTEACHTNANSKKRTGMTGMISTNGSKGA